MFSLPFTGQAQQGEMIIKERLPSEAFDVMPPSARVAGLPGKMQIVDRSCKQYPLAQVRQRIVNISRQEWEWFGSTVIDMMDQQELDRNEGRLSRWWRTNWMDAAEAERLADDVAGYWAAAPNSSWILEKQNRRWSELGITARWRDFWSAAFISWVMCEAGLGKPEQFSEQLRITLISIRPFERVMVRNPKRFMLAYDIGEKDIQPGDMLCRGSRPAYRNLGERRSQMGQGARTHCDIVIELDNTTSQIKVIGGNVRGSVRMKYFAGKPEGQHAGPCPLWIARVLFTP